MADHPQAMPHGALHEVFSDIFFVTGTMRGNFGGDDWQFSRNMTVVREGGDLTLFNSVRLDDEGLAALEALGTVKNVVRVGALHGHDDAFYVERYGATLWGPPGVEHNHGITADKELVPGGELPISGASVFAFQDTNLPELIFVLDRDGGIAIGCDALQNYVGPDEFFDDDTAERMKNFGFFKHANMGPVWVQANEPKGSDFARLMAEHQFEHALCGHGEPVQGGAKAAYGATFSEAFGI